jgi:hypothetical protein
VGENERGRPFLARPRSFVRNLHPCRGSGVPRTGNGLQQGACEKTRFRTFPRPHPSLSARRGPSLAQVAPAGSRCRLCDPARTGHLPGLSGPDQFLRSDPAGHAAWADSARSRNLLDLLFPQQVIANGLPAVAIMKEHFSVLFWSVNRNSLEGSPRPGERSKSLPEQGETGFVPAGTVFGTVSTGPFGVRLSLERLFRCGAGTRGCERGEVFHLRKTQSHVSREKKDFRGKKTKQLR